MAWRVEYNPLESVLESLLEHGLEDLREPMTVLFNEAMKLERTRHLGAGAWERGTRSERVLTLALAEMYVQGVSTRKVSAVVEELCSFEVTSTEVSRAAAQLDETLTHLPPSDDKIQ